MADMHSERSNTNSLIGCWPNQAKHLAKKDYSLLDLHRALTFTLVTYA